MLQSWFLVNNKVQTKLTPIWIPDKNSQELRNNVNPTSKKIKIFTIFYFFMFRQKTSEK